MSESIYHLICTGCGVKYDHIKRVRICPACGNVANIPPLTSGEFENLADGDEPKKPPPVPRKGSNREREPEKGGGTF